VTVGAPGAGVAVGGAGVAVAGTGVDVGGADVGVAVGGAGVNVAVGGAGVNVRVGGAGVRVGPLGVGEAGTGVAVGGDVAANVGVGRGFVTLSLWQLLPTEKTRAMNKPMSCKDFRNTGSLPSSPDSIRRAAFSK
jgi:hypothetical protein